VGHQGITDQAAALSGAGTRWRCHARFDAVAEWIQASRSGLPLTDQIIDLPLPLPWGAEDPQCHAAAQPETLGLHQIPGCGAIGRKQRFGGENEDQGVTHASKAAGWQLVCRGEHDLSASADRTTSA
jgi:hypothetical protein